MNVLAVRLRVTLTYPNECHISLCSDKDKHTICRCLKDWKLIDNDENIDNHKSISTELTKEVTHLACRICENSSKVVAHSILPALGNAGKTLFNLNAFSDGFKDKYPEIYVNGDFMELEFNQQDKWGYRDEQNSWINVSQDEATQYRFDANWFIDAIRRDLDMSLTSEPEVLVEDRLWYLGHLSLRWWFKVPLFFANRLAHHTEQAQICQALQKRMGFKKGIVLTSSKALPVRYSLHGNHEVISLYDCLTPDGEQFHIDTNHFQSIFHDTIENLYHFSFDYQHAVFDNEEFDFTKLQGMAVKIMDEQKTKIDQNLLLRMIGSNQDIKDIFKKNGKLHRAYRRLIKVKRGQCWIEY